MQSTGSKPQGDGRRAPGWVGWVAGSHSLLRYDEAAAQPAERPLNPNSAISRPRPSNRKSDEIQAARKAVVAIRVS